MMGSLEALLSAPTDSLVECLAVGPGDVRFVVQQLEALLNRCLYCIRLKLPRPLEVLLTVVGDAGDLQPDRVSAGLLQPAEEGTCADVFSELVVQLLSRRAAAFRLQFDVETFFKALQLFCCAAPLKDRLGARLVRVLLGFMQDVDQHADDYRVHRSCCSALISLLRGSAENKNRVGPECAVVAACLDASSDFFFRMQCGEVLYRVYKHRSTFLTAPATATGSSPGAATRGPVAPALLRGIQELPNDSSLLQCLHQLLDRHTRDAGLDDVIAFAVLHVDVAGATVARATTMYFSPLLVVMPLTTTSTGGGGSGGGGGGGGGYLTIPYEHVRSVKLTRDHHLEMRLYVVPAPLSAVMNLHEEGMDKLHVSLTRATMHELRSSAVHTWVAARKNSAPRRAMPPPPPPPPVVGSRAGSTARPYTMGERPVNTHPSGSGSGSGDPSQHGSVARRKSQQPYTDAVHHISRGCSTRVGDDTATTVSTAEAEAEEDRRGEGALLGEVHRAATLKAARRREVQHAALQHAVDEVREELADLHRWSARERDVFEARCCEDMEVVRRAEAVLKESATECVRALNTELEDVQALGALLKDEVDALRETLAKSVGKSQGVEEALLTRIKHTVDARMRAMEAAMLTADASTASAAAATATGASLEDVSRYITQRMRSISSGAAAAAAAAAASASSTARVAGGGRVTGKAHALQPQLKERRLDYS